MLKKQGVMAKKVDFVVSYSVLFDDLGVSPLHNSQAQRGRATEGFRPACRHTSTRIGGQVFAATGCSILNYHTNLRHLRSKSPTTRQKSPFGPSVSLTQYIKAYLYI